MALSDSTDWREKLLRASGFTGEQLDAARSQEPAADTDPPAAPPRDKLSIFVEKKGRSGKTATIVTGFTCSDEQLRRIASKLKNSLGCGGSCRDGEILVQGSRRDETASLLRAMGYKI